MTVGVGVIGLGFMGATHVRAYSAANGAGFANRLVAVAGGERESLQGFARVRGNIGQAQSERLFDPADVVASTDAMDVLGHPGVDLVSICTPTDTHADLASEAMRRGKHVVIEKPVATTLAEVQRIRDAAGGGGGAGGVMCMAAMCVRFWPGWSWLKDRIEDGSLGAVRSAVFTRLGARPDWSDFYGDVRRSGGALFDLHVHDADFVRYLFGDPVSVMSAGSREHVTTLYRFGGDRATGHVVAEGGWVRGGGFGFRMRYVVEFEAGVAEFDLARTPALVLHRVGVNGGGESEEIEIEAGLTGYDLEIRAALDAVRRGGVSPVPIEEAVSVTRLLECEMVSLESGAAVRFGGGG